MNVFLTHIRVCCLCMSMSICLWARPSMAAPGELTLAMAIDATLQHNPELAVSGYALKISDARLTQAGLKPNPQLALDFENGFGTGSNSGVKALETTLSLSQTLELSGKRAQRLAVAALNQSLSGVDRQTQQLDVLAEVTRRFIDLVAAQHAVTLTASMQQLAEQTLAAITTRVQAARSPLAEQSRASIALTRARIEQQRAEHQLQAARQSLAATWGARDAEFSQAIAALFTLPALQSYAALRNAVQDTPDFLRYATEARLRDAELRLAQAQSRPDLNLNVGVRRFEASDELALVAGVSMALPTRIRNQGEIREAELRREQLRVQSQSALIKAEATLFGLYQQLLSTRASVAALRDEAIPQAQLALEQTQSGYERGRFSYLELAAAQQELLTLQRAAIDAAADYHRLIVEVERLTARPLITTAYEVNPAGAP